MTRILSPEELPVGARIARDVLSGHASTTPLLRAGAIVTEGFRSALERAGVGGVFIDDDLGEDIQTTPALTERTRLDLTNALTAVFAEAPKALAKETVLSRETIKNLEHAVADMVEDIAEVDTSTLALTSLASIEAYTLEHSIDVAVLGLLVATHLFNTNGRIDHTGNRTHTGLEAALRRLGCGLALHDLGKVGLPRALTLATGTLADADRETLEQHPLIGIGLLDDQLVSAHAKAVVRSHHERFDGSGYPDGMAGEDIPHFARIAAVVDGYSAMTTRSQHHDPVPPQIALATIRKGKGTKYDPEVVDALCAVVAPYPPGSEITLVDGSSGVVSSVRPEQLELPVVRVLRDRNGAAVAPREIDLLVARWLAPPQAA